MPSLPYLSPAFVVRTLLLLLTLGSSALASPASERPAVRYKATPPPPAELSYSIKATQSGIRLDGSTLLQWHVADNRYSITTETRTPLLGKILEAKSEGIVTEYGLTPTLFTEKRFRKPQTTTTFDRQSKLISFSKSGETYPIRGGEQDQSSAIWQLAAIARAAPARFKPGSSWTFFVAGQSDAEPWALKVMKQEQVATALGAVNALHIVRVPQPGDKGKQFDMWLAPSLEWYPVRLRFTESDGDFIEQILQKITKK